MRPSSLAFVHVWLVEMNAITCFVTRELVMSKTALEASKDVAKRNRRHVVCIIARNRDES